MGPTGTVSLRQAINTANADTIDSQEIISFAAGLSGTIDLTQTLPNLANNITISGPGASNLTVQRDSSAAGFSIFTVNSEVNDIISGLTLTGGDAQLGANNGSGGGGAIYNGGTLTVSHDIFIANTANSPTDFYSGEGGAIYNSGTLTTTNDTFSNDTIVSGYWGNGGGGAIYNSGTLTTTNDAFRALKQPRPMVYSK